MTKTRIVSKTRGGPSSSTACGNPNGWKDPPPLPTSGLTLMGVHIKLKRKRDFLEDVGGWQGFSVGPFYVRTFRQKRVDWTAFTEREMRMRKG